MDIILIPGFWLDASSWDEVIPALRQAGHGVHALTLPGMESKDADRSQITLRDHVDAVVEAIDYAAADARPSRVARVVYVDSLPMGDGGLINDELPVENGEVPLPDWSLFEKEDLVDLDDDLRAAFRERAIPTPAHVASDRQRLSDERRFDVPATVIACEFSSAQVREWMAQDHPAMRELAKIRDVGFIDLPTGHWPQFTKPAELGQAILASVAPPSEMT